MRFIILIAFLSYSLPAFCQNNFCGTSLSDQKISLNELGVYKMSAYAENDLMYIPLMVHNVSNDNSQGFYAPWNLFESLCTLNEDFKASGIQFFLERDFNYIHKTSWNDHEEFRTGEQMMRQSNVKNMANCYLVSNPAGNCGYFTYGGDGVALSKSCLGKKSHTWAHEMGHYFSLPHTFYGWEGIQYSFSKETEEYQSQVTTEIETVNRDFCNNQADQFCDTPPDYISNRWTCGADGFSNIKLKDVEDSTFRVDGSLFMSYSNDDCMSRFSFEQMDGMKKSINGPRSYLKRPNIVPKFIDQSSVNLEFPSDSTETSTKGIVFKWEKVENAKYYIIQISRTETFTIVIKNLLLTEPFVEIDSLIQGKNYWWRVRAFSEFDFCGAESAVGYFRTKATITSTEHTKSEEVALWPNPVGSFDFVQLSGINASNQEITSISILDCNGRNFKPGPIVIQNNNALLELGYLPDGFYLIRVNSAGTNKTYKLIIKNR